MSSLVLNVIVIQHILRYNVISKVGDKINITFLLFIVTYFIMTNTTFNISSLHIWYIKNFTIVRNPHSKRKHKMALGHLFLYLVEDKYNLSNSTELYHISSDFTNHFFHLFYDGKRCYTQAVRQVDEEEEHSRGSC